MGDKDKGIASLKIKYSGKIISEEIVSWHLNMGKQITQILGKTGERERTNFIRSRIDFIFKDEKEVVVKGTEIPLIFISGHSDEKAQSAVATLEDTIKEVTDLPCIAIDSFYDWRDMGKENFKSIRDKLKPLFKSSGDKEEHIHPDLRANQLSSLENKKQGAFQGWLLVL